MGSTVCTTVIEAYPYTRVGVQDSLLHLFRSLLVICVTNYALIPPPVNDFRVYILPTQAKLSEEDEVLKERVEKLNEEVNILNTSTALRCVHTRRDSGHRASIPSIPYWKSASFSGACHSRTPSSPATVPIVLVSSSSQDSLDRLDELETMQNNVLHVHCTGINGIAGEIDIDN